MAQIVHNGSGMPPRVGKWADGEPDLRGWVLVRPYYIVHKDAFGLLVISLETSEQRAIFYDKTVQALRSVPCDE